MYSFVHVSEGSGAQELAPRNLSPRLSFTLALVPVSSGHPEAQPGALSGGRGAGRGGVCMETAN